MAGTPFLSAADVADVKADGWATQLALSGQTCTILRPTQTRNPVTGYAQTFAPVAAVACVVRPAGLQPQDRRVGEALRAQTAAEVLVDADTDVRKDDRIEDEAGVRYEVIGQPMPAPNDPKLRVAVVAVT